MAHTRPAAVAGYFYPENADELNHQLEHLLRRGRLQEDQARALIVPHAGYIYSGAVAAQAYAQLQPIAKQVKRIAIFGPAHRTAFLGMAVSRAESFTTPLGDVKLDTDNIEQLCRQYPQLNYNEQAHAEEHCLEVQLPFLQKVVPDFSLIPIVVGECPPEHVFELMEALWQDESTFIIVSSDLSHYHDYRSCQQLDQNTTDAIEHLQPERIGYAQACGRNALNGLLLLAQEEHLKVTTLDVRNSGDTAGSKDKVVGYGAYAFH
jgi:AmmeMemoRadiSam system protein B